MILFGIDREITASYRQQAMLRQVISRKITEEYRQQAITRSPETKATAGALVEVEDDMGAP